MKKLEGKRIALVGPRRAEELSALVTNLGGIPVLRPAQGTTFLDESNLEPNIKRLIDGGFDWIILTTGVGLETLYKAAVHMELSEPFLAALQKSRIAARGYKTVNALKKLGLQPLVRDDDGSTAGLLRELAPFSLKGCRVALQLHGDPAPKLIAWLQEQGADFYEILPYHHTPPEEGVLQQLTSEIIGGEIDAVNFTSTPQARFLMAYAREHGLEQAVLQAFSTRVTAVAVGKVTAQALREEGITRMVIPQEERMGSAIVALAKHYEQEKEHSAQ